MNSRLAWRIAVRDSGLDTTAKHVALTLDVYMDHRGIAWPSKSTLATATGYTVRTVDRALVRVEHAGFVVVAHSRGRKSNLYAASLPNPVTGDTVADVPTPSLATPTPYLETSNPVPGALRSRKKRFKRTTDRTRDQNYINLDIDVDPAVLELAHGWIASHRMPA